MCTTTTDPPVRHTRAISQSASWFIEVVDRITAEDDVENITRKRHVLCRSELEREVFNAVFLRLLSSAFEHLQRDINGRNAVHARGDRLTEQTGPGGHVQHAEVMGQVHLIYNPSQMFANSRLAPPRSLLPIFGPNRLMREAERFCIVCPHPILVGLLAFSFSRVILRRPQEQMKPIRRRQQRSYAVAVASMEQI
jgi:hypothetical protein